ncbi:MAG: AI-2E family transporter [Oscillospiraceae bacterium]|jgi:predicted PurR-regulated permease PerM
MDKKLKDNLIVVGFGVTLFVALYRLDAIGHALRSLFGVVEPVLAGCLIAFVLNVPMGKVDAWLEKRTQNLKKRPSAAVLQVVSLILTLLLVAAVIALLAVVVVPPLVASISEAASAIQTNIPVWEMKLQGLGFDSDWIDSAYNALLEKLQGSSLSGGVDGIINSAFKQVSSALGKIFTALISFIIAIYLLVGKKSLASHSSALATAVLPSRAARRSARFWRMLSSTYADFFSGQCVEAVILGLLMFFAFSVMRLPYAGLVAVLTAVSSFIPYVGSFLACSVGALLILMIDPMKALISIITYSIVQFCENQFIYPHVVGRAVGLPAIWTLIAVLIGGKLGGILGMIFCIPLTSVFYTLIGEWVSRRVAKKARRSAEEKPQSSEPE